MSTTKSVGFRRQRERSWRELEKLVASAEARGFKSLPLPDRVALPKLYRATASALSVARSIALDRNLVEYLEALVARAYCCVYGARGSAFGVIREFVGVRFPVAVNRAGRRVALSGLVVGLGVWLGYDRVTNDPELYYAFVEPDLAAGRDPLATTTILRDTIYMDADEASRSGLSAFAAFLFTHNSQVAMLAFALGVLGGVPVLPLLFSTGAMLGAFFALFASRGLGVDFAGWVLPHGITEILAIVLAGAAGLELGRAMLFPGARSRRAALEVAGREGAEIMLGVVGMLLIAGLIEGIFRQTVTDLGMRYALALTTALFWLVYFVFGGRTGEVKA